jgi:hypothetical protein
MNPLQDLCNRAQLRPHRICAPTSFCPTTIRRVAGRQGSGGSVRFGPNSPPGCRQTAATDTRTGAWVRCLLEHKPFRLVNEAIVNKTARTAWSLLVKFDTYRAVPVI